MDTADPWEDGLAEGQLGDSFGGDGTVLHLACSAGYTTLHSSKLAALYHRKRDFTVCKLKTKQNR